MSPTVILSVVSTFGTNYNMIAVRQKFYSRAQLNATDVMTTGMATPYNIASFAHANVLQKYRK